MYTFSTTMMYTFLYFITVVLFASVYRETPTSIYAILRKLSFGDYERKIEDIIITTILWQYMSLSKSHAPSPCAKY